MFYIEYHGEHMGSLRRDRRGFIIRYCGRYEDLKAAVGRLRKAYVIKKLIGVTDDELLKCLPAGYPPLGFDSNWMSKMVIMSTRAASLIHTEHNASWWITDVLVSNEGIMYVMIESPLGAVCECDYLDDYLLKQLINFLEHLREPDKLSDVLDVGYVDAEPIEDNACAEIINQYKHLM